MTKAKALQPARQVVHRTVMRFTEGLLPSTPGKLGIAVHHLTTALFLSKQPEPLLTTPEEYADIKRKETAMWAKVIKEAKIRAE